MNRYIQPKDLMPPRSFPDLPALHAALHTAQASSDPIEVERISRLIDRNRVLGNGYGTHVPLLAAIVSYEKLGDVIELGAGHFSTPMLHTMCKVRGSTLYTFDGDKIWLDVFKNDFESEKHVFTHVSGEDMWPTVISDIADMNPWGVAFVDQLPGPARLASLKHLANYTNYIVVHDTNNPWIKGLDDELAKFKYRFDDYSMCPMTTVVSNLREMPVGLR